MASVSRLFPAITYLVLVCIVDVRFLRFPFAFPFSQFLPKLFYVLPLVDRSVLISVIQHGPSEECSVRSGTRTTTETVLLMTSHKGIFVPGRTQFRLT